MTQEQRFVDKSDWPRGQWDNEPDRMYWVDDETHLPCLIVRGPSGALCGYVGVPKTHPFHGKGYDDVPAEAHGGLTYAAECQEDNRERGVCHVTDDGDTVWWFGFDCAHAFDRMPAHDIFLPQHLRHGDDVYRDISYVQDEVTSLARQLAALETA